MSRGSGFRVQDSGFRARVLTRAARSATATAVRAHVRSVDRSPGWLASRVGGTVRTGQGGGGEGVRRGSSLPAARARLRTLRQTGGRADTQTDGHTSFLLNHRGRAVAVILKARSQWGWAQESRSLGVSDRQCAHGFPQHVPGGA